METFAYVICIQEPQILEKNCQKSEIKKVKKPRHDARKQQHAFVKLSSENLCLLLLKPTVNK